MSTASTVAETFYSRLLWHSRNSCAKLSPTTSAPTRSPDVRVYHPWIEVALCGPSGRGGLSLGGQAMGSLRQRRVLSSVTVKRRKSWLLAASALASLSLGISEPALARSHTARQPCCRGQRYLHGSLSTIPPPSTTAAHANHPTDVTLNSGRQCHPPHPGNRRNAKQLRQRPGSPVLLSANGVTINVTNPAAGEHRGLYVETQVEQRHDYGVGPN